MVFKPSGVGNGVGSGACVVGRPLFDPWARFGAATQVAMRGLDPAFLAAELSRLRGGGSPASAAMSTGLAQFRSPGPRNDMAAGTVRTPVVCTAAGGKPPPAPPAASAGKPQAPFFTPLDAGLEALLTGRSPQDVADRRLAGQLARALGINEDVYWVSCAVQEPDPGKAAATLKPLAHKHSRAWFESLGVQAELARLLGKPEESARPYDLAALHSDALAVLLADPAISLQGEVLHEIVRRGDGALLLPYIESFLRGGPNAISFTIAWGLRELATPTHTAPLKLLLQRLINCREDTIDGGMVWESGDYESYMARTTNSDATEAMHMHYLQLAILLMEVLLRADPAAAPETLRRLRDDQAMDGEWPQTERQRLDLPAVSWKRHVPFECSLAAARLLGAAGCETTPPPGERKTLPDAQRLLLAVQDAYRGDRTALDTLYKEPWRLRGAFSSGSTFGSYHRPAGKLEYIRLLAQLGEIEALARWGSSFAPRPGETARYSRRDTALLLAICEVLEQCGKPSHTVPEDFVRLFRCHHEEIQAAVARAVRVLDPTWQSRLRGEYLTILHRVASSG